MKTVLVAGATRGIGRSITEKLLHEGFIGYTLHKESGR